MNYNTHNSGSNTASSMYFNKFDEKNFKKLVDLKNTDCTKDDALAFLNDNGLYLAVCRVDTLILALMIKAGMIDKINEYFKWTDADVMCISSLGKYRSRDIDLKDFLVKMVKIVASYHILNATVEVPGFKTLRMLLEDSDYRSVVSAREYIQLDLFANQKGSIEKHVLDEKTGLRYLIHLEDIKKKSILPYFIELLDNHPKDLTQLALLCGITRNQDMESLINRYYEDTILQHFCLFSWAERKYYPKLKIYNSYTHYLYNKGTVLKSFGSKDFNTLLPNNFLFFSDVEIMSYPISFEDKAMYVSWLIETSEIGLDYYENL